MRVVLDSNAIDPIADLPGALEMIAAAVDEGRLTLLTTPAVGREIAVIPDPARRSLLQAILGRTEEVLDGALVFDQPFFNVGRFSEEGDYEVIHAGNDANVEDALIALAAKYEAATLVTNDKRLRPKARALGIQVVTPRDFLAQIGYQAPR